MTITANCKLCGRPLSAQCSDDYADLGDPYKLAPMLSHDRCYDLRDRHEKLKNEISKQCLRLVRSAPKVPEKVTQSVTDTLRILTQSYARWWQDAQRGHSLIWDDAIIGLLIDNPDKWPAILADFRNHAQRLWRPTPQTQKET